MLEVSASPLADHLPVALSALCRRRFAASARVHKRCALSVSADRSATVQPACASRSATMCATARPTRSPGRGD